MIAIGFLIAPVVLTVDCRNFNGQSIYIVLVIWIQTLQGKDQINPGDLIPLIAGLHSPMEIALSQSPQVLLPL